MFWSFPQLVYTRKCRFRFPQPCRPKNYLGCASLSLRTQKPYMFFSPQSHDMKYFDPSPSQFTPKKSVLFLSALPTQKIIWATLPSASELKNHICFVPLSLKTWNIFIFPSVSLHRKYIGFVPPAPNEPVLTNTWFSVCTALNWEIFLKDRSIFFSEQGSCSLHLTSEFWNHLTMLTLKRLVHPKLTLLSLFVTLASIIRR